MFPLPFPPTPPPPNPNPQPLLLLLQAPPARGYLARYAHSPDTTSSSSFTAELIKATLKLSYLGQPGHMQKLSAGGRAEAADVALEDAAKPTRRAGWEARAASNRANGDVDA